MKSLLAVVFTLATSEPIAAMRPIGSLAHEANAGNALTRETRTAAASRDSFNPISAAVGAGKHGREAIMHMLMEYTRGREEKAENKKKRRKERQTILAAKQQSVAVYGKQDQRVMPVAPLQHHSPQHSSTSYESTYDSESDSSSSNESDEEW